MYQIDTRKDSIKLTGPEGTVAEVIPSCGALLNHFSIQVQGKTLNVIDGFADPALASRQIIPAIQSAKLSPFVCRIQDASYRYQGALYHLEKFSMNGSAIHGLLFDEPFTVADSKAAEGAATVALQYAYRGSDVGYPFLFDCTIRYTLTGNSIRLETEITNRDHRSLPLADGWHPYFTLGGSINDLDLQFHSHEMLEFVNLIPSGRKLSNAHFNRFERIGNTELDNSFLLDPGAPNPLCILRDPRAGVQIEISPDESYPILQIYTPPHRRSIAIENLSGAPDNFNNGIGLLELQPGEQKRFSTTYTIRIIP